MKKIFKMIGIIAFCAVIALGMTACSDGGDDNGTDTGGDVSKVASPTANPPAGAVAQGEAITLESATSGAVIYYTTNGTSPTAQSTEFTTPISVNADMTIRAIAMKEGMTNSDVVSFSYTIDESLVAMPAPNPAAGTVNVGTQVALTCATEGTTIRYTIDGSTPTTSSTIYETHFVINDDITIKAIAIKGVNQSNVMTAEFKLPRYTVTFNSAGGSEVANATVKHGDSIPSAPTAPTREFDVNGLYLTTAVIPNYTLTGWNNGATPFVFGTTTITDNITLTAQWTHSTSPTAKAWNTILNDILTAGSAPQSHILTVIGDHAIAGDSYQSYVGGIYNSITITLKGKGKLSLNSAGNMFSLYANHTLIIDSENLTLQGYSNNSEPVIMISDLTGSKLELKNGTITGNHNSSSQGGGVVVHGTFIMTGGEITGNSTNNMGGGVFVNLDGNFTMSGGIIKSNTGGNGGGVAISTNAGTASFTKSGGGIIYGSGAGANSNISDFGVAIRWWDGTTNRLRNTTLNTGDNISTNNPSSGWTIP